MKKSQQNLLSVLVLIVIILAVIIGISSVSNNGKVETADATAGWSTYAHKTQGYEIKYPAYLSVSSQTGDLSLKSNAKTSDITFASVQVLKGDFAKIKEVYTKLMADRKTPAAISETTIDGKPAITVNGATNSGGIYTIETVINLGGGKTAHVETYGKNLQAHADFAGTFKVVK